MKGEKKGEMHKNSSSSSLFLRTAGSRKRWALTPMSKHPKLSLCSEPTHVALTVTSDLQAAGEAANGEYPSEEQ